jgi:AmmeMemoRadiSam system protein A
VRAGAFVSIYARGVLRGCIGSVEAEEAVEKVVARMAVAAARDDPRFPPVQGHEVKDLAIELSILTPPIGAHPDDVVPGRDGVVVKRGFRQGLLLPQVADKWRLDRVALLRMACRKAGLADDDWQDERTQLQTFRAFVFGTPAA